MKTRIESERIIPKFISKAHWRWWMNNWYYPSEHWKAIHNLVVERGTCAMCGGRKRRGDPFQAHHGNGAYRYLWREQEALYLMECVHASCHIAHHKKARIKQKFKRVKRALFY